MIKDMITYRTDVRQTDPDFVREIVSSSGFFNKKEIGIAVELVDERLVKGIESGYYFIFAEIENQTLAYSCFGPIPATQYSYDLYWIAVDKRMRNQGIGKRLMKKTEEIIKKMGGRRIYIETSGRDLYIPTRKFYLSCLYREDVVMEDFYAPGDAKYIYVKVL